LKVFFILKTKKTKIWTFEFFKVFFCKKNLKTKFKNHFYSPSSKLNGVFLEPKTAKKQKMEVFSFAAFSAGFCPIRPNIKP